MVDAVYVASEVTALKEFFSTIDEDRDEECALAHAWLLAACALLRHFAVAGLLMMLLMIWLRK